MKFLRNVIFVLLLLAAGAGGLRWWQSRQSEKKPEMPGLREQLDAAAERSFPVPKLDLPPLELPKPEASPASSPQ